MLSISRELSDHLDSKKRLYREFGPGHDEIHVENVIRIAEQISNAVGYSEIALVHISAIYHDLGLSEGRDGHHIRSRDIVLNDERLRKYLGNSYISLVANAVANHRASSGDPVTILSRIIADADSLDGSTDINRMMYRIAMSQKHSTGTIDFEKVYTHMKEKFSSNGYMKLILPESRELFRPELKKVQLICDDKEWSRTLFNNLNYGG